MEDDLNERYNIFLRNGEFRDDVVNRLDGFIDTISTESVLRKLNALFGADWIKNVKKEFQIQDFEGFIDTCVIKAKQAIGYYVSNRQYKIGTKDYGNVLFSIATEYNDALLVVENANIGWAVIQQLIDRGYRN